MKFYLQKKMYSHEKQILHFKHSKYFISRNYILGYCILGVNYDLSIFAMFSCQFSQKICICIYRCTFCNSKTYIKQYTREYTRSYTFPEFSFLLFFLLRNSFSSLIVIFSHNILNIVSHTFHKRKNN